MAKRKFNMFTVFIGILVILGIAYYKTMKSKAEGFADNSISPVTRFIMTIVGALVGIAIVHIISSSVS